MRRMAVLAMFALVVAGRAAAVCSGDCSGDHAVTVSEMVTGVNLALGNRGDCAAFDSNGDHMVAVNELVAAVANLLGGCPFIGQYSARVDVGDGEVARLLIEAAADGTAEATLMVVDASAQGGALRVEIPLLHLTGTIDLDTGAFHFQGTADGVTGPIPVDIGGTLPDSPRGLGTVQLQIDSDTFSGSVAPGDGRPTATPTATRVPATPTPTASLPAATPTFTPTSVPANFPTPGASCEGGAISLHFSNASGTNSFVNLGPDLNIGKGSFNIIAGVGVGGGYVPCSLNAGDIIRRVQITYINPGASIASGTVIPLGRERGQGTFDYIETPTNNPLGTRGWRSDSGALVLDAVDGSAVRFHITAAVLSPEPSFSFQQPATGTLTIDAGGRNTP
ncbi:MAG: hypothetical protein SF182_24545 [Deltaproteobacteria bacterium]|nr:hypothetical protein [Deltaproteobacteria bacterium]